MYIMEEWVLVLLGSQHKYLERSVRFVSPDYLSVSCDYGVIYACNLFHVLDKSDNNNNNGTTTTNNNFLRDHKIPGWRLAGDSLSRG